MSKWNNFPRAHVKVGFFTTLKHLLVRGVEDEGAKLGYVNR